MLMKLTGAGLMVAGWLLVLCALSLLKPGAALNGFVFAGLAVEGLGLVMAIRAHVPVHGRGR